MKEILTTLFFISTISYCLCITCTEVSQQLDLNANAIFMINENVQVVDEGTIRIGIVATEGSETEKFDALVAFNISNLPEVDFKAELVISPSSIELDLNENEATVEVEQILLENKLLSELVSECSADMILKQLLGSLSLSSEMKLDITQSLKKAKLNGELEFDIKVSLSSGEMILRTNLNANVSISIQITLNKCVVSLQGPSTCVTRTSPSQAPITSVTGPPSTKSNTEVNLAGQNNARETSSSAFVSFTTVATLMMSVMAFFVF